MSTERDPIGETFEEFKNSFAYGSRNDLFFKWIKNMPDEVAAEFLRKLLMLIGDATDTSDWSPVLRHVIESEITAYSPKPGTPPAQWSYENTPFAPFGKPLREATIALVASSGHFVKGQDPRPFGVEFMTQDDAVGRINEFLRSPAQLSEIPVGTPSGSLSVRHPGYDVRGAKRDPNVTFPLERMVELQKQRVLGQLASPAISFVGAAAQLRIKEQTVPQLLDRLRSMSADAVLLVAA